MANWETLKIDAIVPKEIREISNAVSTITSQILQALSVVKNLLEIARQLATLASGSPLEAAIKLAIDEIDKLLEDFTKASIGLNVIAIPIQKQFFGPGAKAPLTGGARNVPKFNQLLDDGAFRNRDVTTVSLEVVNFIDSAPISTGGNQGFWKALTESLSDEGDINRPLFASDAAVVGSCVIFGSDDLPSLQPNFALFSSLMQFGERADMAAHSRPYPSELTARAFQGSARPVQATGTGTASAFAVRLTWPSMSPVITAPLFGNSEFVITEIFIIRSEDPGFRTKFAWSDIFSRQPLAAATDLQSEGDTKVLARIRNDGFVTGYTDASSDLSLERTYYYATAVRYTANNTPQPMSNFSNCVRIDPVPRVQSRKSVPPDWHTIPGMFELFPFLSDIVSEVRVILASLRRRSISTGSLAQSLLQTINQVNELIAQAERIIDRLDRINARIAALTSISLTAAVSTTVIAVESGGINAWMAELARRLSDSGDTSRPPFDTGSELVAGAVIVAGGTNLTTLAPVQALMSLFFGASPSNPLLDAINSIEQLVAPPNTVSFDESMQPGPGNAAIVPVNKGFDSTMTASPKPVC